VRHGCHPGGGGTGRLGVGLGVRRPLPPGGLGGGGQAGDRLAAREPLRPAVRERCGGFRAHTARGLQLRPDRGRQYLSDYFPGELRWLGMESSPALVGKPEGNGVAEWCIRQLQRTGALDPAVADAGRCPAGRPRVDGPLQPGVAGGASRLPLPQGSLHRLPGYPGGSSIRGRITQNRCPSIGERRNRTHSTGFETWATVMASDRAALAIPGS